MRSVSVTEARRQLSTLLDTAQNQAVLIRRQNRVVAALISAEEYEKIHRRKAAALMKLCDRIGAKAAKKGMTEEILADILKDR